MQQFQITLDLARDQRIQRDFTQARRNFAALLEGEAPEEMQRTALLELALMAQEENQLAKAQQIFSQYQSRFPMDPGVPEVLLRQGLLYRRMGAPALALSKFYAVMTSALTLKAGSFEYYQRLVLQAQTEIADTYFLQGKHEEAAEFFSRLLKLDSADLNKTQIHYKLVRCLNGQARHTEAAAQAKDFLVRYPTALEQPEVRFILAQSLKQLGQNHDALQQVLLLLKSQQDAAIENPHAWTYWRQRTGNEIANQLYQEGDYLNALEVYQSLASLDNSPAWQMPVWYQIGLVYEKLQQPTKAAETYARISDRQKELASDASPGLKTVVDMAQWRNKLLDWQTQAEGLGRTKAQVNASAPSSPLR